MRVLCVIDSLSSGGAQRQMVNTACGLKNRGHDVELFFYYPNLQFFRGEIDRHEIPVHEVISRGGFSWRVLFRLFGLFHKGKFDAVLSFLDTPNLYCEVVRILSFYRGKLLVGERSSYLGDKTVWFSKLRIFLHTFANYVVANSHTQANWLRSHCYLRKKVFVIYNGYPIYQIYSELLSRSNNDLKFLVIGRINPLKNGLNLLEALVQYFDTFGTIPVLAWAGRQEQDSDSLMVRRKMDRLLEQHPRVAENWFWLGERDDIPKLLEQCDALIHLSFFEGLPNAICEAFIMGRPVIASKVCDHPILVEEGVRGILCDPSSPTSISNAIRKFKNLTAQEKVDMGKRARAYAERNLSIDQIAKEYENLLRL